MSLLDIKGYAIAAGAGAVIAGAVAGWGAWAIQGNIWEAKMSTEKAERATELKGISDVATQAAQDALTQQKEYEKTIAEMDARLTKEKTNDQAEIARLSAAVAAGTQRLRIRAACPAPSSGTVPKPGTTPGLDDGSTVELAPDARPAYFSLSAGIKSDQLSLRGLQDYVRNVLLKGNVP